MRSRVSAVQQCECRPQQAWVGFPLQGSAQHSTHGYQGTENSAQKYGPNAFLFENKIVSMASGSGIPCLMAPRASAPLPFGTTASTSDEELYSSGIEYK